MQATAAASVCAQHKSAMVRKCQAGELGQSIFSLSDTFSLSLSKSDDVYHV